LDSARISTPGAARPEPATEGCSEDFEEGNSHRTPRSRGVELASPSLGTFGPCRRSRNSAGVFIASQVATEGFCWGQVAAPRQSLASTSRCAPTQSREASRRENELVRVHRGSHADRHGSPHGVHSRFGAGSDHERSRDRASRAGEEQSSPSGRARVSERVAEFGRNVVARRSVVFSGRP